MLPLCSTGRNRLSLNLTRQLSRPNNTKLWSACYCPVSIKEAYIVQQDQAETLTSSNTNPGLCFCLNTSFFHGILPEIILKTKSFSLDAYKHKWDFSDDRDIIYFLLIYSNHRLHFQLNKTFIFAFCFKPVVMMCLSSNNSLAGLWWQIVDQFKGVLGVFSFLGIRGDRKRAVYYDVESSNTMSCQSALKVLVRSLSFYGF